MAQRICLGCMEKINDKYIECPYCGYIDGIPAKEAYHMEPGSVLSGRYIVGRVVGYGGFGVTYIGYDGLLEKKIAIKEYLPSEFATRMPGQTEVTVYTGERQEQFYSGIDKFVEEAKRLAQFKEVPGIVRIYDSFTENKTAYIIMEYLEGETLKSRLKREGRLSVEESLRIIMPILTALEEVHKIGIIHRDIAPDNIFLTSRGEVKLLDFGAARYATTTHSKSLSVIIKQGYAPEEQYRSRGDQGPWTDVYACGATLYKMLTGVTPEDSMERAGKDTLQPPSKQGVKLSKNLDTAIMNAMNIRIEDRTQSAEEFEAELVSEAEIKRKKNHERKMDIGRWPLWIKLVSGMAACGILTFGVLLATNVIHFDMKQIADAGLLASNQVYVPNLVNYGVEEAETKTLDSSLILQIVDKQNSDEIPRDKILSQDLMDGEVVEAGTIIEIVVSAGGEIVYVEELTGLTQEEAISSLEAMGLSVEVIEEESEIAPGCVIRYEVSDNGDVTADISAGVEKGSIVKLYISKGRSDIDENMDTEVPQVVGLSYSAATTAANNAKLYIYRIRSEYSASVPKGQVMEQNPTGGSVVKQGSSVGVVVSLGIQTTRVPDVQYKDINTTTGLLSQNNLTYEVQYEDSSTVAKNHVIRQSIAPGTEVAMQTKVVVYVSKGNSNAGNSSTVVAGNNSSEVGENKLENTSANITSEINNKNTASTESVIDLSVESEPNDPDKGKIKVPNLVGMTESEVRDVLGKSGLSLGNVNYYSCPGKANYTVLGQRIAAGDMVRDGQAVDIDVCNNKTKEITLYQGYEYSSDQSVSGYRKTSEYRYSDNWTSWQPTTDPTEQYENGTKIRWTTWKLDSNAQEIYNHLGNPSYSDADGWVDGISFARPSPTNDRPIAQGRTGDGQVCWIQYYLSTIEGKNLVADGTFGTATVTATKEFQRSAGLTDDGMVGPNTYNVMKNNLNNYYTAHGSWYACERIKEYKFITNEYTTTRPLNINDTITEKEYYYPPY